MRARRRRDVEPRDDAGFTLIEITITVWILGAVMVGLMGTLITMSRNTDYQRRTTIAETEMRRLEAIVRAAPYVQCPSAPNYASAWSNPWPDATVGVSATSVKYWNGATLSTDVADLSAAG